VWLVIKVYWDRAFEGPISRQARQISGTYLPQVALSPIIMNQRTSGRLQIRAALGPDRLCCVHVAARASGTQSPVPS